MINIKKYLYYLLLIPTYLFAVDKANLMHTLKCAQQHSPFPYDISLQLHASKQKDPGVMLCFHGFASSNRIGSILRKNPVIQDHLVSFNFPDAGKCLGQFDPLQSKYGTIYELLPALYVMKDLVVNGHVRALSLYGFSSGGGAVVTTIAVLNDVLYDEDLQKVGITTQDKQQILTALQKGTILLDCPLKSFDEMIQGDNACREYAFFAQRAKKNRLRPLDALTKWNGLALNVFVHFQKPDTSLSNRDDALFIQRLKEANTHGRTFVVIGHDGGHLSYHTSLWDAYQHYVSN